MHGIGVWPKIAGVCWWGQGEVRGGKSSNTRSLNRVHAGCKQQPCSKQKRLPSTCTALQLCAWFQQGQTWLRLTTQPATWEQKHICRLSDDRVYKPHCWPCFDPQPNSHPTTPWRETWLEKQQQPPRQRQPRGKLSMDIQGSNAARPGGSKACINPSPVQPTAATAPPGRTAG